MGISQCFKIQHVQRTGKLRQLQLEANEIDAGEDVFKDDIQCQRNTDTL